MNQPAPSEMPGMRSVGVPQQYRGHPFLSAGPYFTIPEPLLRRVIAEVGNDRFDSGLLEMENALSRVCEDHSFQIGFWGGQPIQFQLLRPRDLSADFLVQGLQKWGKSEEEARAILALAGQRLDWTSDVRRAYCGWLMTNHTFIDEHRQVFEERQEEVAQHGVPIMGPVTHNARATPGVQLADARMKRFLRAFEDFFVRWRLEGMPAPFVPQPIGIHLPVTDLRPVLGHMKHGGTTFYIPDLFPIPSHDKFREMLEDALRKRSSPDHLAGWFDIVQSDNRARNQIPRYARIFELQHYMRALHGRHAEALRRKKSALITAFSEFFDVSNDTIERDLQLIAGQLGRDWYLPDA